MKKNIFIFLLLIGGVFEGAAQKIKLIAPQSGTSIKVISRPDPSIIDEPLFNYSINDWYLSSITSGPQQRKSSGKQDTFFVAIDSGFFKIKKNENLVLVEREGYLPNIELVNPDWLKGNKKRIELKPLDRTPIRSQNAPQIRVRKVSFNVPPKGFVQRYYESYYEFQTDLIDHVFTSGKTFEIENSVFRNYANIELARLGFLDTLKTNGLKQAATIDLSYDISRITEYKFGNYCFVELKILVKLPESFGLNQNKIYTVRSKIGYDESPENFANNRELIADAISRVCLFLLKDETLYEYFHNSETLNKPVVPTHTISAKSSEPNLENAALAVVTIITDDGHGSGCFIGNEGYLVTNYHVIANDSLHIKILFQNGVKKPAVLLKSNTTADLALLKCDTTIGTPLVLSPKASKLGADVFAIGTPKDINLGQSLSRGIISGMRVIDGRNLIQSDVSVNEGHSGGALVNRDGYLVGIICSKLVGIGVEGVSFAIPSTEIEKLLAIQLTN